jgi:hypothetical protein
MTTLLNEPYTGTNGASWPTGWTLRSGTATIQANAGRLAAATGAYSNSRIDHTGMAASVDHEVTFTMVGTVAGVEQYVYAIISSDNATTTGNWEPTNSVVLSLEYDAVAANSTLFLKDSVAGTVTDVASVTKSLTGTTKYAVRFQHIGSTARARVWVSGQAEPGTWDITATIAAKTAGRVGFLTANGAATTIRTFDFDDVLVTDVAGGSAFSGTRAFTGSGTLAGSGVPKPTGARAFTGSGALTGAGVPKPLGTAALTGAGTLTGSGVADTSAAPGTVLDIGSGASQNHFDVQIAPTGGTAEQHTMAEIAAGYSAAPYFEPLANGGQDWVRFWARMDGPTTSGATFSRAELREVNADGSSAAFDALTGEHVIQGVTKIVHLPPTKPEVVVAQLHNGTTDRVAIRTQLIGGVTKLVVRINGSAVTPRLEETYVVGTEFAWKIRVIGGTVEVYYNDMGTPFLTSTALVSTGSASWYFKSGMYNQSNATTDAATEYGEAWLRALDVTHALGFSDALALAGSGTLAGSGAPAASGTFAATGSGTLTGQAIGQLALTGSGALAATPSVVQVSGADSATGSGTLGLVGGPNGSGALALTGSGTLTGQQIVFLALSGSGTLGEAGTPSWAVTEPLGGSGALTLSGKPTPKATGQLDSTGDLSLGGLPKVSGRVTLSGAGALSLLKRQEEVGDVALDADGNLALWGEFSASGSVDLSGSGTLLPRPSWQADQEDLPPGDTSGWWELPDTTVDPVPITLFAGDLRTGLIRVRKIPAETSTAETTLNAAGSIWATVKLPLIDPDTGAEIPFTDLVSPGRSFLGLEIGGKILNAGPIWYDELNVDTGRLELRGSGLRSYWDYRFVEPVLSDTNMSDTPRLKTTAYTGLSLRTIAKRLIQQAQSWTGGSVPVVYEADVTGTAQRTYPGYELHRVGEVIDQLIEVENGPDIMFRPRFAADPRYVEWVMQTGNPELVQIGPDHVWDTTVPTPAIQGIRVRRDATVVATDNYQVGITPETDTDNNPDTPIPPLVARKYDSTLIGSGWPRMETVQNRSSVADQALLQGYANEATFIGRGAEETWTFQAKIDLPPLIQNFNEGDYAVIVVKGMPRLGTARYRVRIVGLSLSLDSEFVQVTCMPERVRV